MRYESEYRELNSAGSEWDLFALTTLSPVPNTHIKADIRCKFNNILGVHLLLQLLVVNAMGNDVYQSLTGD